LDLVPDLDKGLRLIGLQALSLRQQPQVEVWLVVAARSTGLLPLHSPCRSVVAAQEVAILLDIANVMLIESRRVAIDEVQKAGIVWVRREGKGRPGNVRRSASSCQRCISPCVETGVLALQSSLCELIVGDDCHL
jgi:hypothetical protein